MILVGSEPVLDSLGYCDYMVKHGLPFRPSLKSFKCFANIIRKVSRYSSSRLLFQVAAVCRAALLVSLVSVGVLLPICFWIKTG